MSRRVSRRVLLGSGLSAVAVAGMPVAIQGAGTAEPDGRPCSARPLAQDYTVVFHNTEPRLYIEGCGLARFDDGTLVATVPIVPRAEFTKELRVSHSHVHVLRSGDHGQSWQEVAMLPYYSAAPWIHDGALYLFAFEPGPRQRNDDMVLLKSSDGGKTWSKPVTLFAGHFWNCNTGFTIRGDRLYWAVDDITKGNGHERTTRAIAGDLSGDVMNPKAWRMSNPVEFPGVPAVLTNPKYAQLDSRFLEPNVLEVRGKLRVITSVKAHNQTTANLCAVSDLTDDGELKLDFVQFHPMPGGHLDFCILWDQVSQMFWATANLSVDTQEAYPWWEAGRKHGGFRATSTAGDDRRTLMLLYGVDGLNWFQAGCIAQAPKISQSFMYARPVIDGDDLAVISRSSIAAAHQHDADHATFHRVRDFRRLALNLVPEPEA